MLLWHMHSEVLDGFYASEVYVTASNQEIAVMLALDAFKEWLEQQVKTYWFNPLVGCDIDDTEYPAKLLALHTRFMREAYEKLKQVPNNVAILRKT